MPTGPDSGEFDAVFVTWLLERLRVSPLFGCREPGTSPTKRWFQLTSLHRRGICSFDPGSTALRVVQSTAMTQQPIKSRAGRPSMSVSGKGAMKGGVVENTTNKGASLAPPQRFLSKKPRRPELTAFPCGGGTHARLELMITDQPCGSQAISSLQGHETS